MDGLRERGIPARLIREATLGTTHARLRAIRETTQEWLLFVDDDNELDPGYIAEGMKFALSSGDIGCFGGKILLPSNLRGRDWLEPFLPYLAIKDLGEKPIVHWGPSWAPSEPPAAGAFVRRSVLNLFLKKAADNPAVFRLGRVGKRNLASCEDSLLMRGAFSLQLATAYNPKMVLYHHIDPRRLSFTYLMRLMYAYGVSHVNLEWLLNGPQVTPNRYASPVAFLGFLRSFLERSGRSSLPFRVGMVAYHLGSRAQHLRSSRSAV